MAITIKGGLDGLVKFMTEQSTPYFKVLSGEKGYTVCESDEGDNRTVSEGTDEILRKLSLLDGLVTVKLYDKQPSTNASRGGFMVQIQLSNAVVGIGSTGAIQAPTVDYKKEAKELFDDWKDQYIKETQALQRQTDLERQLQELRTELRENKKESSTDRVIKRLEPYIEPIVGKIFDMDINANTTSVGTTAEAVDLETAIKSLHEIEPDTAIIVAKLAALKKNNEANYNMAKNMLMAQS